MLHAFKLWVDLFTALCPPTSGPSFQLLPRPPISAFQGRLSASPSVRCWKVSKVRTDTGPCSIIWLRAQTNAKPQDPTNHAPSSNSNLRFDPFLRRRHGDGACSWCGLRWAGCASEQVSVLTIDTTPPS